MHEWPMLPTFFATPLTEARIEVMVEKAFDLADAMLMGGKVSQSEYDARAKQITQWADGLYASMARRPTTIDDGMGGTYRPGCIVAI